MRVNHAKAYLAAEDSPSSARSRLPAAHEVQGWAQRVEAPPSEGASCTDGQAHVRQEGELECVVGWATRWVALPICSSVVERRLRLRHSDDFARLRQAGRAYRHPMLVLNSAANTLSHNRYGFITAKSLGNAVTRNRARRLLREAVRILHPRLRVGYDLVLVARSEIVGQPFVVVQRIVEELCRRAGLVVDG